MRLPARDERVTHAIEDAVNWLRRVQLTGIRLQRVPADTAEFEFHTTDFDVIVVHDEEATLLWARHYEIGSDRPVFAGRNAVTRYALSEIERERRTGTPWYGDWPRALLGEEYPRWRKSRAAVR